MTDILQLAGYAAALSLCITVILTPWLGLALYYALAIVHPEVFWPEIFNTYRISLITSASTILGLAILIKRNGFPTENLKHAVPILVLVLFLLVNLSHYTADVTSDEMFLGTFDPDYMVQLFNKMIIFFLVSLLVLRNWFQVYSLIYVLAASVVFLAVWANVRYFTEIDQLGILERVGGPGIYSDENVFATVMVIGFPVVYYLSLISKRLMLKAACYLSLCAIFHAFYLTGSRGGLFAAVIVILYIGICSKSKKAGVAVVILFLTTLAIQGQTVIERYNDTLTTYTELQDVSKVDTRQTIWAVAIEIIKGNLWTGIGPGRFHVEQLSFTPYDNIRGIECETGNTCNTHNTILQFTTSAGIAAGALYLAFFIFVTMQVRFEHKNRHLVQKIHILKADGSRLDLNDFSSNSGNMIASALLGLFVCSLFLNFMIFELLYFLFVLFIVRATLVRHELANASRQKASKRKKRLSSGRSSKSSKRTSESPTYSESGNPRHRRRRRRRRSDSPADHAIEVSTP